MMDHAPLLLAAFPPELAGLDIHLPPGWRVNCVGVGAISAAVNTARLLAAQNPSLVLFVGTCGGYDERLAVGDLLCASAALDLSLDVLEERAYLPKNQIERWPATLGEALPLDLPAHAVAVPAGITRTREGAKRLSAFAAVEHLELTGVLAACREVGVPCGAVLGVANQVGPEAHGQWLANHHQVSRKLIAELMAQGIFRRR